MGSEGSDNLYFLSGGGEMGELARTKDWSRTSLGDPVSWPQSLKTLVAMMLCNPFGMYILWGNDYIQLYNDGFRPILGATKHPQALGITAKITFEEIWDTISPMFEDVMKGNAVRMTDFMVPLNRNGFTEECYFDFSYSPVRKDDGEVGGIFVTVIETTGKKKAIDDLKESETRFRTMAEASDILIATSDHTSNSIYFNQAWGDFTGRSVEELLNFGWADLIHEKDRQNFIDIYLKAFEKQENWKGEFRILTKDGTYRWLLAKGVVLYQGDGSFAGYISSSVDITDQVNALRKVEENEQDLRSMVMQSPIGICLLDASTLVTEIVNDCFIEVAGKSYEAIAGKYYWDTFAEAKPYYKDALEKVVNEGITYHANEVELMLIRHGNEERIYVTFVYAPLKDAEGKVKKVAVWVFENTQQVRSRQKVEESEQEIRSIIEGAPFPIGVYKGKDMQIEFANQAIRDTFGKGNDVIGKSYKKILPELDNQYIFKQLDNVLDTGIPFHAINQQVDIVINGILKPHYFNYSFTPLRDQSGKVYGVVNTAANVTDLVLANLKIKESEENLRNTILKAPIAMCIFKGPDHVVELANERMFELWGKPGDQLINRPIFEALPEVSNQGFEQLLDGVYKTGQSFSAQDVPVTLPRQGKLEHIFINFLYEAYTEADGTISGVMAVAMDVTAQVNARKLVENAYERFLTLSEAMPQIVWTARPDGNLDYFSKQWQAYSALDFDQSKGQGWGSTIHEDDVPNLTKHWTHSLHTGIPYQVEARVRRSDGVYRWFLIRALPIRENGLIVQWVGTCTDIQDQKQSAKDLQNLSIQLAAVNEELTASNEELSESNNQLRLINSDLDNFIYTASHDLKAPIANIEGLMINLKEYLPQNADSQEDIEMLTSLIDASINRFQKTIGQLTDITKLQTEYNQNASRVNLKDILEEIKLDMQILIMQSKAEVQIDDNICQTIHFAYKNLRSIIYNLLSNAIKYASPKRLPVIRISCTTTDDYQILSVSDNGLGIDLTQESKLFAIFGRLHDHVEGSGVGLYIVKKMVENAGGKIEVDSKVDVGSTFRIYFKNRF